MRDPERQNKYANSFSVMFPDFPSFLQRPKYFTLIQKIGNHDVVELYYHAQSKNMLKALNTGVAVEIKWANDITGGVFIGYVSDIKSPSAHAIEKFMKVVCVAASYPLKDRTSKIMRNCTASEFATQVAIESGLKPVVTKSSVRYGQLSLSGHSKWEKLQEIAHRSGYACQVYNTELHFHPLDVMINKNLTTMPVMALSGSTIDPVSIFAAPTLEFFEPTQGDHIESNQYVRTTKVLGGVDPYSSKVYFSSSSPNAVGKNIRKATKDPLFSTIDTSVVVTDDTTAKNLGDAKAQLSRLSIPARGFGQGDPRIFPWATIEVRGTGENSDGFWVITEATHTVGLDGKYSVEFHCATDGTGVNQPSAVRPSSAGMVPVVDVSQAITSGGRQTYSYKLTSVSTMLNQTVTGYNVTPRRWVAA
jgi:phage protein D